jgi:hypothetical protein
MTLEAIKAAITELPEEARLDLVAWLNRQTMDQWELPISLRAAAGTT